MTAVWPAVLDAVCADNQMLGAALSDARPGRAARQRARGRLRPGGPLQPARRRRSPSTARSSRAPSAASRAARCASLFELRELEADEPAPQAPPPSEDEIVARFVTEFDAEEIVPDPDDDKEGDA